MNQETAQMMRKYEGRIKVLVDKRFKSIGKFCASKLAEQNRMKDSLYKILYYEVSEAKDQEHKLKLFEETL